MASPMTIHDPRFEDKLVDVVGLYLNPPARAVVFSFDEKTQCQAMDRTQPSLPMVPGRAGTMVPDRAGTMTHDCLVLSRTLEESTITEPTRTN